MITDDEIRRMAGHPDSIPSQYIEWFLKGYRECEAQQQVKNLNILDVSNNEVSVCVCKISTPIGYSNPSLTANYCSICKKQKQIDC